MAEIVVLPNSSDIVSLEITITIPRMGKRRGKQAHADFCWKRYDGRPNYFKMEGPCLCRGK